LHIAALAARYSHPTPKAYRTALSHGGAVLMVGVSLLMIAALLFNSIGRS
jgi:hypothetical protein